MKSYLRAVTHGTMFEFPGGFVARIVRSRRGCVIIAEFPDDHEASENGQRISIRPIAGKSLDASGSEVVI